MGAGRGRRTGIILIVLILVVVLVAVGGLLLLQNLGGGGGEAGGGVVGGGGGEEATPVPTATPPPTLPIIVAARDIPRGARLTVQDVTVMRWPLLDEAPPPVGVLVVSDDPNGAGLEQVEGRIARVDILNGQAVLEFMITPGDQPVDLTDTGSDAALMVPSGMVAMALPTTRLGTVAYALRPGDHVDVFMSYLFADVQEEFQTLLPNQGILLTDDPELIAAGFQSLEYTIGLEDRGLFGTTLLITPNEAATNGQIPRRTTQLVVDNALVMRLGNWSLEDIDQPIVVTPIPTATPNPEGEDQQAAAEPTAVPTPIPAVPPPDVITLAMPRQDALVLLHSLYEGASIDIALRSALDDDITDIVTDPVTLDYIINFYNVTPPEQLPIVLDPRASLLNLLDATGATGTTGEGTTPQQTGSEGS
jgi:Flp pilus assembly protein CpaB